MGKYKETLRRALRTFLQAFVGYVVGNISLIAWTDGGAIKQGVKILISGAVACGLAALMNLPAKEDNEDGKS